MGLYADSEIAGQALSRYYSENGLPPDGGRSDRWARYRFGSLSLIAFPNFDLRRQALLRHDLHHIVNDLDTSPRGEGLIAAWELGSGCGRFWISWFMESQALWWGLWLAPREMWTLFMTGRHSRNYFHEPVNAELRTKTVGELRRQLLPGDRQRSSSARDVLILIAVLTSGLFAMAAFFPIAFLFSAASLLRGGVTK